ncbi:bifunctional DNA primase/polymerase [Leifsonia sp. ZF2019]|uniref:bifunctional DNA primase/polymerase n=1 Tax=Leifsonia sp. ZF2019 TaxID=2781978 RepID=UPI003FA3A6F2
MRKCEWCGTAIVYKNAQAVYCSSRCRVYAHRARNNPFAALRNEKRWVLWDSNKRPIMPSGAPASSTDPSTWSMGYAVNGHHNIGFVLGDGFACIDLDHCLDGGRPNDAASEFLKSYPKHYIEISPSGDGLHIWGTADEGPGTRRIENGLSVERYTTGRYITVTGRVFQPGNLLPL